MARVLLEQDRVEEAAPFADEALAGKRRIFGEHDPETWEAKKLLASVTQSESLLREVYDAQVKAFGQDDTRVLETLMRIGYDPALFAGQDVMRVAPLLTVGIGLALRRLGDKK